ncbi:MAG TPA: amylo-alpha-1,6-glucosidase [Leptolyngbyaceae cyanobacterium]
MASNSDVWKDDNYQATVEVKGTGGRRSFSMKTTAPFQEQLSDWQKYNYKKYLPNPREITESLNSPYIESDRLWFDALYALALEEARQCSVSQISDGAFNNGKPLPAPEGGYFETGLFWNYVWTRDTSYAVDLGLAVIDPIRSLNSLKFKVSELREGGNQQIIQDTGTGGSYPISSDRVVWSIGARALLKQLQGDERDNFAKTAYTALKNTIEHDRQVVFEPEFGLYRGEQSLLDWREQSYPQWTADDPVQIGMSKALSTNACHFSALVLAASLAGELGDVPTQQKYSQWAENLRQAIRKHLYLPDKQLYSTFITTAFDFSPAYQYDSLGSALAILLDIADETQAAQIVANYPHLPKGAPVIYPQQKDTIIYHNHAIWPFVSAYWLKAAKKVKNDAAVTLEVNSLIRGAALSLSNMENFDVVTGLTELQNSQKKEPAVNSPRQLWSVAGYLSMVHEIIFGLSWTDSGITVSPFITRDLRCNLFLNSQKLTLNRLPYRGHQLNIVINLPPINQHTKGAYTLGEVRLNGQVVVGEIAESMLKAENSIEVDLLDQDFSSATITLVNNLQDYRERFAPRPPIIDKITEKQGKLEISFNLNKEESDQVVVNIYRNGKLVAEKLKVSGNSATWQDPNTEGINSPSYCYTLESVYTGSGNISQRAKPFCYWGSNYERIYSVLANDFQAVGGNLSDNHGKAHFENWGAPTDSLTVKINAKFSGSHGIQVVAGNGAGPINTGITCAVKRLQMRDINNTLVADGYLVMPHLGNWERWLESSVIFTKVDLIAGHSYIIKIFSDEKSINMSSFSHYKDYTGNNGIGGIAGAYNYVNIAEIKLLSLT